MSITNPIILAIIAGSVAYVLMLYFCKDSDDDKKKSKKGKSKSKKSKTSNEMIIIVPVIIAIGTWFLASHYSNSDASGVGSLESDSDVVIDLQHPGPMPGAASATKVSGLSSMQQNNNPALSTLQRGGNAVPHISSDDPTRSYNLIGSGINIPRSELKIPSVLIDYQ